MGPEGDGEGPEEDGEGPEEDGNEYGEGEVCNTFEWESGHCNSF